MTDLEFERIFKHMKRHYGIDLSRKREIIAGRLGNYVKQSGYETYGEYLDAVEQDATGAMEKTLVDFLTTNHTFFMREFEHFEFIRNHILPELREKEAKSHDLRIWCAAASTGEEPYTLAMVLADYFGFDIEKWDTTILATDISNDALRRAKAGIYTTEQIDVLPAGWKRRYLHQHLGRELWEITDEIKSRILFRQFNLMDTIPFRKPLHLVMLRNVMIYFDHETKNALVKRIYDALEPDGYLIVGKTETVDCANVPFYMIEPSIFVKR